MEGEGEDDQGAGIPGGEDGKLPHGYGGGGLGEEEKRREPGGGGAHGP